MIKPTPLASVVLIVAAMTAGTYAAALRHMPEGVSPATEPDWDQTWSNGMFEPLGGKGKHDEPLRSH